MTHSRCAEFVAGARAELPAVLIAWRTKNVLLTIAAGMRTVWVAQGLFPR